MNIYIPVYETHHFFDRKQFDVYFSTAYENMAKATKEIERKGYIRSSRKNHNYWIKDKSPNKIAYIRVISLEK